MWPGREGEGGWVLGPGREAKGKGFCFKTWKEEEKEKESRGLRDKLEVI